MATQVMTDANRSNAANAVSADIYQNLFAQYVAGPAIVRIRARAAAVGLRITVLLNGRVAVQDQEITSVKATPPVLPDDLIGEFPFPGGRLFCTLRNTTGGAIVSDVVTEVIQ